MTTTRRNHSRRVRGLVVTLALLAVAAVPPGTGTAEVPVLPAGGTFVDDDQSFAEGSIEALVAAGVVEGCGPERFCPERVMTRAEAAALLVRAFAPTPEGTIGFPDVDGDAWYAESVGILAGVGVIVGHDDGTYRPGDGLTRAQMALLLMRILGVDRDESPQSRFVDVGPDAPHAWAVEALAARGITLGCAVEPAMFCPDDPVRRDQMAAFLARALGLPPQIPPVRWAPLNGMPVDGVDWHRRVTAVKVDDARDARPQSGIAQADAVFETLVEGGRTRWIALYHQSDSSHVGPVRSIRPTDTGLVLPLGATVVASGGQQWIVDQVVAAGVPVIRERDTVAPAMVRIEGREAPYNLYGDTRALRALADSLGISDQPPPPMFTWGPFPAGPASTQIDFEWSDPITVTWIWDGARYRRWRDGEPHRWVNADGSTGQVSADSLVVLIVSFSELAPPEGATGSPVPVGNTIGQGAAFVFAEGRVVRASWSRSEPTEPFALIMSDGSPLSVPPGVPWVSVFPAGQTIRS